MSKIQFKGRVASVTCKKGSAKMTVEIDPEYLGTVPDIATITGIDLMVSFDPMQMQLDPETGEVY